MAKKKNRSVSTGAQSAPVQSPPPKQQQKTNPQKATGQASKSFFERYRSLIVPAVIAVITWLFLKECLNNQFTNWDDPGYIKDNPLVKDVSSEGIGNIFSFSNPVMGNYHPLTVLSYAIEYSYKGLQPYIYHLDSLLLHLLATLLVYWFVLLLSRRPVAAAVAALLFGLHPMHIESVAWIAGRKDVLYGSFYLGACVAYIYYLRAAGTKKWLFYTAVLVLFLCSLLSKPVAVVLPVVLLVIDYFEGRKLHYSLLVEKVPHFAMAIACGLKSIKDQHAFGSLNTLNVSYDFIQRIALGCYALITYLWKAVAPAQQCCFYPYPPKVGGALPASYYVYPLIVAAVIFVVFWFGRKSKVVVFGSLFFLINIALLLQFIPVGGAILADRYSYIPYLGLFFMAGWFVSAYFEPGANKQLRYAVSGVAVVYCSILGYLSSERCQVWYDPTSLWRDEIEKEPVNAPNAYNNLGFNYFNKFNDAVNPAEKKIYYDSAYVLLNRAIELQPTFANPYISLGELLRSVGKFAEAKQKYYKALSLNTSDEFANAYLGLGIIFAISHNFDSSGYCFSKSIQLKPYFPEAHSNYGNFFDMIQKPDSALVQYATAIQQNPDMYAPHLNRGRLLQRLKRCDDAMKDFEAALALNPDNGEVYYARSFCHAQRGNKVLALQDIEKARSLGFTQIDNNYYQAMKAR